MLIGTKLAGKVEGMWTTLTDSLISMATMLVTRKLEKRSYASHLGLRVLKFSMWSQLSHNNHPAENEQNLPHGFKGLISWSLHSLYWNSCPAIGLVARQQNSLVTLQCMKALTTLKIGGKFKLGHDATSKVPTSRHFRVKFIKKLSNLASQEWPYLPQKWSDFKK